MAKQTKAVKKKVVKVEAAGEAISVLLLTTLSLA